MSRDNNGMSFFGLRPLMRWVWFKYNRVLLGSVFFFPNLGQAQVLICSTPTPIIFKKLLLYLYLFYILI